MNRLNVQRAGATPSPEGVGSIKPASVDLARSTDLTSPAPPSTGPRRLYARTDAYAASEPVEYTQTTRERDESRRTDEVTAPRVRAMVGLDDEERAAWREEPPAPRRFSDPIHDSAELFESLEMEILAYQTKSEHVKAQWAILSDTLETLHPTSMLLVCDGAMNVVSAGGGLLAALGVEVDDLIGKTLGQVVEIPALRAAATQGCGVDLLRSHRLASTGLRGEMRIHLHGKACRLSYAPLTNHRARISGAVVLKVNSNDR